MAGRRTAGPQSDLAPLVLLGGVAAAGAAAYFGAVPVVVAWLAVLVAAWVAVPPVLTGKKDAYGYPQPANPAEQRKLSTWRAWKQLRWRLVLPSSDWLPGWPPLAAWAAAVVVGAICFLWPVRAFPHYHVKMAAEHWADALAGAWLVASVTAARRAATQGAAGGPARPATRFDAKLVAALRNNPVASTVTGGIGASMGALAGIAARYGLARYHHWAAQWAVHHPHHVPPPQWAVVAPHMAWLAPLSAVGGALAGIGAAWHQEATGHWRKVSASSDEWAPRWASLKIDPAPALVDHRELGPAMIWTFDAPPGLGAQAMWGQYKKISPTLGAGLAVAVLEHPDGAPGTRHPIRFNVIAWSELPDFTDPGLSPELATWAAHSCFAWATEAAGYGRPVPVTVERVSAEGARSAWASRWAWPGGPGLVDVKAIAEGIDKAFGCEVLIDHKADTVFFGALGAGEGNEGLPPDLAKHLSDLRVQQVWDKRWSQIAGIKDHPPICRPETAMTAELEDGTEVHRQAFVTRQGIDPAEVRGLEPKIATTLQAAPYVAVCGWPVLDGRPGERHPQAMTIYWADETVPTSPEHMGRSEAAAWVLAGMANKAFDDGHLARPELAGAVELSAPGQRSHLWALRLRLYGGVVVSNVRSQVSKLQQALQVSWLRVAATDEPDLVIVYAGAVPSGLALEGGERAQLALVALDWEQAWLDSKVVGAAGEPPKLAGLGHMPHNADVSVLDFTLPSGVDRSIVRAARGKLRAATGNAYVEDADSPKGADAVRLLVSRDIPLPKLAPVDWGAMDGSGALAVPVGTGTDGEPVFFDLQDSAHLLVVGATGSGKSVLLSVLVYGWLAKGAKVVVVDPVKGGADFAFAQGWARFATDLDGSVAAVRAAYAEASLRKQANAAAKVSSWLDMDEPPAPLVVLIDEFTSVLIPSPVPKKTGDPELDSELEALEAENRSRTEIGVLVSKLAREARSAGVVVLLAAQKLAADTLEKIPGKDLKTNLGRALIGQASDGERLSALRAPRDAPVLSGDIPPGRGLYEPIRRTAVLAQFWYATQAELGDQLRRRLPPPTEAPVLEPPQDDDEMVDVGELELSLEDLLGGEKDDETEEIEGAGPLENENTANEVNDSMTAGVENGEDDQGIAENVPEEALFAGNGASHGPSWPEKSHAGPDELFPEPEPVVGPYDDPFN